MQCEQCRQQIESGKGDQTAMVEHLKSCSACQAFAEDLRLQRLLSTIPVPPAREGFVDQALKVALSHSKHKDQSAAVPKFAWPLATAASLVAVVLLAAQLHINPNTPLQHQAAYTQVATVATQPVAVLLNAPQSIEDAMITVHLDDNLGIEGYPQGQPISWHTRLKAGGNKLTLPIQFLNPQGGEITVELQYQGVRKQLQIPVSKTEPKPLPLSTI